MTFHSAFLATVASLAAFFLCLLAASASIGQLRMAWRSYTMGIVYVAITMAIVYLYHILPPMVKVSPVFPFWYGAAAAIALFRALQHFRKAWQIP